MAESEFNGRSITAAVEGALLLIMLCYFLMPAYRFPARLHAFAADDDTERAAVGGQLQPAGSAD